MTRCVIVGNAPINDYARIRENINPFFSLLCVDGPALGVNITGAKFPLTDGSIMPEYQYAVSNEVLPESVAEVFVEDGELLLIRTSSS